MCSYFLLGVETQRSGIKSQRSALTAISILTVLKYRLAMIRHGKLFFLTLLENCIFCLILRMLNLSSNKARRVSKTRRCKTEFHKLWWWAETKLQRMSTMWQSPLQALSWRTRLSCFREYLRKVVLESQPYSSKATARVEPPASGLGDAGDENPSNNVRIASRCHTFLMVALEIRNSWYGTGSAVNWECFLGCWMQAH